MVSSINFPKAYSEVYCFINALGISYIEKTPVWIYNTIKENRDINYNPKFEINQKITKDIISQEGLSLIAALNLQYWCENEKEKLELKKLYLNNTNKEDEKYSYDNLFKNNNSKATTTNTSLVEYKESIFKRIINKIKKFFKR